MGGTSPIPTTWAVSEQCLWNSLNSCHYCYSVFIAANSNSLSDVLQHGSIGVITTAQCNALLQSISGAFVWDHQLCLYNSTHNIGSCNVNSNAWLLQSTCSLIWFETSKANIRLGALHLCLTMTTMTMVTNLYRYENIGYSHLFWTGKILFNHLRK